jgi:hypothetical protein
MESDFLFFLEDQVDLVTDTSGSVQLYSIHMPPVYTLFGY